MKHKGLIVTGTDTGVGKTYITSAIANALYKRGINLKVFKPFATGSVFSKTYGEYSQDALLLKKASHSNQTLKEINPILLKTPLAPAASASVEKKIIDVSLAKKLINKSISEGNFTLIEGIGGLLVPITSKMLFADFISKINLPVLVVARSSLGTINHTLLTLNEINIRKIHLLGVIFNRSDKKGMMNLAEKTSPNLIQKFSKVKNFGYFYNTDIQFKTSKIQKSIKEIVDTII